jgi:homocitrate synthase NifV
VTRITGLPVAHNEPVVGRKVFTHESGIHVDGMLKVKSTFAALDPESVGRNHEFTLGKQSGSQALAHILTEAGVPVDRDEARELLPLIRELAEAMGGTVSPTVAAALARHVLVPDASSQTVGATGSV